MPEDRIEPPFDSSRQFANEDETDNLPRYHRGREVDPLFHCPECPGPCEYDEFPVWMRPYVCRHVTDDERATREAVFYAPPRPSLDDLLGERQ